MVSRSALRASGPCTHMTVLTFLQRLEKQGIALVVRQSRL